MGESKKADTRVGQRTNTTPKMAGRWLYDTQIVFFAADKTQREVPGDLRINKQTNKQNKVKFLSCIWSTAPNTGV